jgi:hypothetical protein
MTATTEKSDLRKMPIGKVSYSMMNEVLVSSFLTMAAPTCSCTPTTSRMQTHFGRISAFRSKLSTMIGATRHARIRCGCCDPCRLTTLEMQAARRRSLAMTGRNLRNIATRRRGTRRSRARSRGVGGRPLWCAFRTRLGHRAMSEKLPIKDMRSWTTIGSG